jgi:hypothetical protein
VVLRCGAAVPSRIEQAWRPSDEFDLSHSAGSYPVWLSLVLFLWYSWVERPTDGQLSGSDGGNSSSTPTHGRSVLRRDRAGEREYTTTRTEFAKLPTMSNKQVRGAWGHAAPNTSAAAAGGGGVKRTMTGGTGALTQPLLTTATSMSHTTTTTTTAAAGSASALPAPAPSHGGGGVLRPSSRAHTHHPPPAPSAAASSVSASDHLPPNSVPASQASDVLTTTDVVSSFLT